MEDNLDYFSDPVCPGGLHQKFKDVLWALSLSVRVVSSCLDNIAFPPDQTVSIGRALCLHLLIIPNITLSRRTH